LECAPLIYYLTDNEISHTVAAAFEKGGAEVRHIRDFNGSGRPPILYGILRGAGRVIQWRIFRGLDYYYVDNGYFDAVYLDQTKHKEMSGTYRIVKNGLIDPYKGCPVRTETRRPLKILALPPSPYSANMHDTTPEDWFMELKRLRTITNDHIDVREKGERKPLGLHMSNYDAVVAFNSMAVMEAVRYGKAVWDFHGIFRNADKFTTEIPYFDYENLVGFYSTKQFTLDEIAEGSWHER
jgi:hypothetical protein